MKSASYYVDVVDVSVILSGLRVKRFDGIVRDVAQGD
jgi:hypothetical protein